MNAKLWWIVRREYIERVRTKAFVIGTILAPTLMAGMMIVPDDDRPAGRKRAQGRGRRRERHAAGGGREGAARRTDGWQAALRGGGRFRRTARGAQGRGRARGDGREAATATCCCRRRPSRPPHASYFGRNVGQPLRPADDGERAQRPAARRAAATRRPRPVEGQGPDARARPEDDPAVGEGAEGGRGLRHHVLGGADDDPLRQHPDVGTDGDGRRDRGEGQPRDRGDGGGSVGHHAARRQADRHRRRRLHAVPRLGEHARAADARAAAWRSARSPCRR